MTIKTLPLRLEIEGEDNDSLSRAIENYQKLRAGKKLFILELLEAGQIIKECGLLDIVSNVDSLPNYQEGNQSQRRAILLAELVGLVSGSGIPSFGQKYAQVAGCAPAATASEKNKVDKLVAESATLRKPMRLPKIGE